MTTTKVGVAIGTTVARLAAAGPQPESDDRSSRRRREQSPAQRRDTLVLGSVAGLGHEHVVSQGLDVSEATLQGTEPADRRRSGYATSEVCRPDCARHRVHGAERPERRIASA